MAIFHIKTPHVPQFRFEFHPETKKLYQIRIGSHQEIAECIADNVVNAGQAHMYVFLWLRGYRYKEAELNSTLPTFHSEKTS